MQHKPCKPIHLVREERSTVAHCGTNQATNKMNSKKNIILAFISAAGSDDS